jgi:cobaltochelatase CobT
MGSEQAAARQQQKRNELCAAALRALTGERQLHYRGGQLFRGTRRVPLDAPHLRVDAAVDDLGSLRGASDGLAMRLAGSDAALHRRLAPDAAEAPVARLVFDLLEQYRCESLARLPGVRGNLAHRHHTWTQAFLRSRLHETVSGLLLFAVAQVVRARLTAEPADEQVEDMIEGTRMALAPAIGTALAGLRALRHDQAAFAEPALAIARHVAGRISLDDLAEAKKAQRRAGLDPEDDKASDASPAFALWLDADADAAVAQATSGRSSLLEGPDDYRIYTTAHDRQQRASAGVRPAQLHEWRERLDARIAAQGVNLQRLARELRDILCRPADQGWDSAQEEGRIDGRRLAQLVASPTERRLFRRERSSPVADAAVSILLDCSGSMKVHAESVAMMADVLLRALALAGADGEIVSELLGFSTAAWNGGRPAREWQRDGSPPHPGRLNETLHLEFKAFDTPWRRARPDIAALLKTELYREGVDGEAVDWACARLRTQPAAHKVLIVVSDGCPMDAATQRANDAAYLDHHLQAVVARHEAEGTVQILGLGVGLDLSTFYRRSRVIDLGRAVRNQVFADVLALLAEGRQRPGAPVTSTPGRVP